MIVRFLLVIFLCIGNAFGEEECDCQWYAYRALRRIDMKLKTFPAVASSTEHRGRSYYINGTVYVIDVSDCKVMTHEFVHHYQRQQYGPAKAGDLTVWFLNEHEAEIKSAQARNAYGECR